MKNKLIKLIVVAFMLATLTVLVKPVGDKSAGSIKSRTYIIGTYEFTSSMALTRERIELALPTSKDDIIYYKNSYGDWINANTGEPIKAPKSFKITHTDLVKMGRLQEIKELLKERND